MWQGRVVSVERDGVCKLVVQMLHTNAVLRLTAPLRDVIDSTYICGGSCAVTLDRCLQWLLGRGLLTLGAVTFCLFVLLTLSMQLQRTCILRDERTHTAACMLPPRHYPMLVGMDAHGDM